MLFCLIVPIISEFQNLDRVLINQNHVNKNHILANSGNIGQQVKYTVEEDGVTITISGYGPTNDYKNSNNEYSPIYKDYSSQVINIKIENGTTYLGNYLFYSLKYFKSIEIPDSIESIGDFCFKDCINLTSITFPDSVKSIGNSCFYNCKSLTSFIVPNQILSLNSSQFYNCYSLESITATDNLESIGDECFKNCYKLKTYDFKNMKSLGDSTFENCTYLTSISLTKCESIGIACFQNCTNLESISLSENIQVLEQSCFKACSCLQSIIIPNKVISLGDSCFENCKNLQYIDIPDNVISIGNSCFFNCSNISKISLGEKVEIIGSAMVSFCYNLNTIEISENNHNFLIHEKVIFNKNFSSLLLAPRNLYSISLPSNLTSIPEYAFCDCTNLTEIEIPDNITTIGKYAFYKCINLKEVKLPSNLLSISDYSFCHCHKLESIIIPNRVKSIGINAFSYCRYLKNVTFGDELSTIGPDAFKSCHLISSFFVSEKNENFLLYDEIVYNKKGTQIILIPSNFINGEIVIHENMTDIRRYQFYDNDKLKSITFGPKLKTIQGCAFEYCKNLISITFINCSVSISTSVFRNCINLKEVNFINITNFGDLINYDIFTNCINLQSIRIPDGVTKIQSDFLDCIGLQSVELPNCLLEIGYDSFSNCSSLSSITFPDNLKTIGRLAFSYCSNLESIILSPNFCPQKYNCIFNMCNKLMNITVPEENKNIKIYEELFYNQDCTSLFYVPLVLKNGNIKFHENLSCIDRSQFKNNDRIKSLEFGPNIQGILSFAFENCINLESVYFENFNPEIECELNKNCFLNCIKLKSIIFGTGVYYIYETAFHNCSIETLSIHDNITIYGNPFTSCDKLASIIVPENSTKYVFSDGIFYSKDYTHIYFGLSRQSEFNFHEGVKEIENYAFANNNYLKSIVIPETIEYIGDSFQFCVNLTSVVFQNGISIDIIKSYFLGSWIKGCIKLKEYIVSENNPIVSSYEGCIYSKDFTELIGVPPGIQEIKFHQNLQIIEIQAIKDSYTRNIVFPENLIEFRYNSIRSCSQLSQITFNDKVRIIGRGSFADDIQLNGSLRLPPSIETIGEEAFSMTSFSEVIFDGTKQPSCKNAFINDLDSKLPRIPAKVPIQYDDESFCDLDLIYDIEKEYYPPEEEEEPVSPTDTIEPTSITTLESTISDIPLSTLESTISDIPLSTLESTISDIPLSTLESTISDIPLSTLESTISDIPLSTLEPTISDIPLPTPVPEVIVDFVASSDLNETELDQELDSKFQSLSSETNKNQVVTIKNITKLKYNSTLKENQYIKPAADSHIDFIGGQLNVVLPDDGIVTVKINEENETKISIKGEGEIKIEKADETKDFINITSNSQINGTVTIKVDDSIDKVFIDSIEFESNSTIVVKKGNDNENENNVELIVNTVTTSLNTNSTLTNVVVRELIRVFQSSTISIENTNIESAAVECNLFDYNDKNGAAKPTLKGVFNKPPKSLVLNYISQNEEDPIIDQDYTIVSGSFESGKCINDWLPVIQYGNTKFNFSSCINNNVLSLDNQRIVVKEARSFLPENNNSSKLTAGQIAGIVIGCVVVVAVVIAIVIYFVIKKRSSISKDEDESDESISTVVI